MSHSQEREQYCNRRLAADTNILSSDLFLRNRGKKSITDPKNRLVSLKTIIYLFPQFEMIEDNWCWMIRQINSTENFFKINGLQKNKDDRSKWLSKFLFEQYITFYLFELVSASDNWRWTIPVTKKDLWHQISESSNIVLYENNSTCKTRSLDELHEVISCI